MEPVTPPEEIIEEQLESLFDRFKRKSKEKLEELTNKIIVFTPIDKRYLNEDAMKKEIYRDLRGFMFMGDLEWDELAEDPDPEEHLDDYINLPRFVGDFFFSTVLGIGNDDLGRAIRHLAVEEEIADKQIEEIIKLIRATIMEMVYEYKILTGKIQRERL
jgi:hypothetical protein